MNSILLRIKLRLYLVVAGYFKFWANVVLKRWCPRIIAITGSVGKTTMLHLLSTQLGSTAYYSYHANSAYGVSFNILGLRGVNNSKLRWIALLFLTPVRALSIRRSEEFYVVEIDGERPHETAYLARWLEPEVCFWVSVGRSHAMYYDSQVASGLFDTVEEAIAHEFSTLPLHTKKLIVVDGSSTLMTSQLGTTKTKVEAVLPKSLKKYTVQPRSSTFKMAHGEFMFTYPLPKETYVQLAMLEIFCSYIGDVVQYDMKEFIMPPGRSNYFKGVKGVNIIDSSYNAHLMSIKSALCMFKEMPVLHKWVVIGDIIEQGKGEAKEHVRLAEALAEVPLDRIILVGRRTNRHTLERLRQLTKAPTQSFIGPAEALTYLERELTGKETILFKGSQYLEGIIEPLLADRSDAKRLCRREPRNVRIRQEWGLPA